MINARIWLAIVFIAATLTATEHGFSSRLRLVAAIVAGVSAIVLIIDYTRRKRMDAIDGTVMTHDPPSDIDPD